MIYCIFNIINNVTRSGVSNLKNDIEKMTLSNFGNNIKYIVVVKLHNHH